MNSLLLKPFSYYTKKSGFIHLGFILVCIILSYINWSQGESQRKINVKLVQSSVRVDVVAMPEKTFQELKALQSTGGGEAKLPEAKAEPVEVTPDKGNEFLKKGEKKKSLSDLLKHYSDRKVVDKPQKAKQRAKDKGFDKKALAKLDGLIKKGNKVKEGSALVGSGNAETLTALQGYAANLPSLIKPSWKLPSYLLEKGLQCRIQVFLNGRGELIRASIYEKSEDPEYDSRALKAVKAAAPFPPPPSEIVARVLRGDILLGFPL